MFNKSTLATILGVVALGLIKAKGSKSSEFKDHETIDDIFELESYENKPQEMFDKIKKIAIYEADYVDLNLISRFRNLESLTLEDCYISRIDDGIGQLVNLKSLVLSDNQISYISPKIGKLLNLEFLWLDNNKIDELPKEIGNLENLIMIHLTNNILETLPAEIGNLQNLKTMRLDRNPIKSLPKEIADAKKLDMLSIDSSNFHESNLHTVKYWAENLHPHVLSSIINKLKYAKPSSQLRRF